MPLLVASVDCHEGLRSRCPQEKNNIEAQRKEKVNEGRREEERRTRLEVREGRTSACAGSVWHHVSLPLVAAGTARRTQSEETSQATSQRCTRVRRTPAPFRFLAQRDLVDLKAQLEQQQAHLTDQQMENEGAEERVAGDSGCPLHVGEKKGP